MQSQYLKMQGPSCDIEGKSPQFMMQNVKKEGTWDVYNTKEPYAGPDPPASGLQAIP